MDPGVWHWPTSLVSQIDRPAWQVSTPTLDAVNLGVYPPESRKPARAGSGAAQPTQDAGGVFLLAAAPTEALLLSSPHPNQPQIAYSLHQKCGSEPPHLS